MLLTKAHVVNAMHLTKEEVSTIMGDWNIGEPCYKSADFQGMNKHGRFVYKVSYHDINTGETEMCDVYIWYDLNADKNKFVLEGDF